MLARFALLAVTMAILVPAVVVADEESSPMAPASTAHPLYFTVNIKPHTTNQHPWTGDLTLKINSEGIINGTYRSTSSRPDPFHGQLITVTGGLSGTNIHLEFGSKGYFPMKGQFHAGQGIVGTAYSKVGAGSATTASLTRQPSMSVSNPRQPTGVRPMSTPMPTTTLYDFVAKQESK